jgi:hypothetical protein
MHPRSDLIPTDYDRKYPAHLGRLIANLSALDFNLRVALYHMDTPRELRRKRGWLISEMKVGEEIEKSWMTDDCYLSDLILTYNERQAADGLPLIDAGIRDLRNAMAHGIIIAGSNASPAATCVKFARPKKGSLVTTVEAKYQMSFEWIAEQTRRVLVAAEAVNKRLHELANN